MTLGFCEIRLKNSEQEQFELWAKDHPRERLLEVGQWQRKREGKREGGTGGGKEREKREKRESQSHFTLALTHDPTHTCDTPYPDAMSCDGLSDVQNSDQSLNVVSFVWSPLRPATLSFKVNCLSTEFAARKHGGWREREIERV